MISSPEAIAPIRKSQQIQYENQGFIYLPQLLNPALTKRVLDGYERACKAHIDPVRAQQVKPHYDIARILDEDIVFSELATLPELQPYLLATLGEDVQLVQATARLFPPGKTFTAPWHSDMANTLGIDLAHSNKFHVKVHFYFEDMAPDQGCLAFLPGTHRLPREMERPNPKDINAAEDSVIIVPKAGDAVLFNTHCLHMCLDNNSPKDRRTLIYSFSHFWVKQFPGARPSNPAWIPEGSLERQIFGLGVDGLDIFDQRPWQGPEPSALRKAKEHLARKLLG
ncbi:phytanoyl-CoA dioxygenase family protein [Edaphobacter aggregans]|uniref:phytanoyl-CoA dioxygenase family protein n=1 Tax=Edaphobacter aggregans TaxID=570835 RepID=UPI000554B4C0|nr:phytanoyl-CoA dioxygenase family protein [Edaphobacter aggregans]